MFAFALYDERHGKLLMARDRLGKKPLHYALAQAGCCSAPRSRRFLRWLPKLASVNNEALLQYMYFGYIPDPLTGLLPIQKLPPGHLLEFEARSRTFEYASEYGPSQRSEDAHA